MFKCGLAYGVVGHYWYKFLDWKFVGNTIKILAKKLSCELLAGPFFGLGMFLAVGYGEGKPRQESFLDFVDNLENLIMVGIIINSTPILDYYSNHLFFRLIFSSIFPFNIIILMLYHPNIAFYLLD